MASFSYVAVDRRGKEQKGSIDANDLQAATAELKRNGLYIASIGETNVLGRDIDLSFLEKKPTSRDMSVFCRQFVSIINAGVNVITALEMLGEQTENKRLRKAINGCRMGIERGRSFSAAMGEFPDIFSSIFRTMVAAGEASGSLDISFTRMAQQEEKSTKLKAAVKKASIYPTVVCVVALVVIVAMLIFVIPRYEDMFAAMGGELPGITLAVVAASRFLTQRWYIVFPAVIALIVGIKLFSKSEPGRRLIGKITLKLPLVKTLVAKTACANMARTLSTLLAAGIPLIEALEITADVMSNLWFKDAILAAREEVTVGNPLSAGLRGTGIFPSLVCHMIGIGEETGDMDGMLTKLAEYYEDEVEQTTAQVMAALEPMIIIALAIVVGVVVLAVLLPQLNMYSSLVELIIVVAIMAVLVALVAPQYFQYIERARKAVDVNTAAEVLQAVKVACIDTDNGTPETIRVFWDPSKPGTDTACITAKTGASGDAVSAFSAAVVADVLVVVADSKAATSTFASDNGVMTITATKGTNGFTFAVTPANWSTALAG